MDGYLVNQESRYHYRFSRSVSYFLNPSRSFNMKLFPTPTNKHGNILLGLLVIVLAIIIIGAVAYSIYKALTRMKPRRIDPDDVSISQWVNSASNEIYSIVTTNGNLPASGVLSDGTAILSVTPAASNLPNCVVYRSTNLIHWERIAVIVPAQVSSYTDTNPPFPNAFYQFKAE